MHLTLISQGTHGDIQPYVALGIALQKAGHQVTLATAESFRSFVEGHNVTFAPLAGDPQEMVASFAKVTEGGSPLDNLRFIQSMLPQMGRDMLRAAQGSDAILSNFNVVHLAYSVAEKLDIPFWAGGLLPMLATSHYPNPHIFPAVPRLWPSIFNRLTYWPVDQLLWQPFRQIVNTFRREELGLGPYPFNGYADLLAKRGVPQLEAYSRYIFPPAADWGERVQTTGFWFMPPSEWQPSSALQTFLDAGPKPLYIGFGSMNFGSPEERTAIIGEALQRTGQRAVVAMGWGGLSSKLTGDGVFALENVPHDWLFPRVSGAIHHGGAGTTAAALKAGVPQWAVTFFGDQPFWGQRIEMLGIGPAPLPRKKLTVDALVQAIQKLQNPVYQHNALALQQKITAEGGTAHAVALIEARLQRG